MNNKEISKVYLLNVPLENDYKNTLYFANASAQQSYFQSKIVKSAINVSYIRKNEVIRFPDTFDNLQNVNYIMYQNSYYSNKWFYAFITDVAYIDDGRCDITMETDYLQTWMFDYQVKSSFVEREHVSDDTLGKNTYPEPIETGPYICNTHTLDTNLNNMNIVMAISDTEKTSIDIEPGLFNNIYNGLGYYVYPHSTAGATALTTKLGEFDDAKKEAINSIFMAPQFVSGGALAGPICLNPGTPVQEYTNSINKMSNLDGYTPRNKKLLCFPYCYLYADNNSGGNAIYKQELFSGSSNTFKVKGALSPGCSIRMVPTNYNGISENDSEGLNAGKFAICCWNSDSFTNWMTSNATNVQLSAIGGVSSIVGGMMMMGSGIGALAGAGMVAGGLMSIGNTLASVTKNALVPDQAYGNTNTGDVVTGSYRNTFHFYNMSLKQEYAKIIDGYFDMFGYKVCQLKVPNKNHRERWWFTKTIDVNIDGAIPNKDMQKIKDCYNSGITFWRNPSEIQDYSLSNAII